MSSWERDPTTGNLNQISGMRSRADIISIAESSDVDTQDNTATFTSSDTTDANATSWTSVTTLASGESHKSIFAKISQMFKNIRYLYKQLDTVNPIGTILAYGGTNPPSNYLLCQGQAVSRTTYAALFSVIGTSFGAGNGSTTFNLPDLRGEFLRGAGTNAHSGCGNGGSVGTHQNPTNIPHVQFWANGEGLVVLVANAPSDKKPPSVSNVDTSLTQTTYYSDLASGQFSARTGNMGTYTTRPTNTSVNYIIRVS